jgi:hypothetical protein
VTSSAISSGRLLQRRATTPRPLPNHLTLRARRSVSRLDRGAQTALRKFVDLDRLERHLLEELATAASDVTSPSREAGSNLRALHALVKAEGALLDRSRDPRPIPVDRPVVLRQNSVRRQVIDLSELIRRGSRLNGHSPAPPASTPPDALRRPPSSRPGEPCVAPPARRLQEDGDPAEVAQQRSTVLGRVVQCLGLGLVEAVPLDRDSGHCLAVAAPPLPEY